jgi:hypothetical protein
VKATLITKVIATAELPIDVSIPDGKTTLKGRFIGHSIIRSKPEQQKLLDRVDNNEFDTEEQVLREMFTGFDGIGREGSDQALEGDDAWAEVLTGPLSSFLVPAAMQGYFAQYGDARRKNSKRLR